METIAEYKARILSYIEGKDPLQVQRKTPELLANLVVSVPEKELYQRPSPDKWSVAELLAHFADAEIVSTWRYRQMIEHNGCPLPGYDQELWHQAGRLPIVQARGVVDVISPATRVQPANVRAAHARRVAAQRYSR